MKSIQKKSLTVNALLLLLLILFFLSGLLMWSQHNQYHNTSWMGHEFYQGTVNPMNWNK